MPEVNVEINGRLFCLVCVVGVVFFLQLLADVFNRKIEALKGSFGEIGDNRLTVMAGIAALDELEAAQREIAQLRQSVADLTRAGEAMAAETEEVEQKFA